MPLIYGFLLLERFMSYAINSQPGFSKQVTRPFFLAWEGKPSCEQYYASSPWILRQFETNYSHSNILVLANSDEKLGRFGLNFTLCEIPWKPFASFFIIYSYKGYLDTWTRNRASRQFWANLNRMIFTIIFRHLMQSFRARMVNEKSFSVINISRSLRVEATAFCFIVVTPREQRAHQVREKEAFVFTKVLSKALDSLVLLEKLSSLLLLLPVLLLKVCQQPCCS